ncbi:hypothetical protein U9M48_015806 [Paspalum notatum var. saurae]|uniref:RRM domain-containing protein n=1 Tax=Paspalum notatum var. saurae TaxID=547442 RepID=A0AAQ3T553_PASNO
MPFRWRSPVGFREGTARPPFCKPEAATVTATGHGSRGAYCTGCSGEWGFTVVTDQYAIGNAIRRTTASSSSPLLQSVRCMSSSKLFVAGLSYATDETTLKNAFSCYGDILEARIITDRESGRSRGFGFVTYTSSEEAATAITAMDGKELQGRTVHVNHANDRAGGIRGGSYGGGLYATTGYGAGSGGGYGAGSGYSSGRCGGDSGGYAGNVGYSDGAAGGYGSNYNNASAGRYAGNGGYNDGSTGGGYASSFNGASGGGYGSGGMYNTTGNSSGNLGGYNSFPNTCGAGNAYGSGEMYNTTGNSGGNPGGYNSSPNTYGAGNYNIGGSGGGYGSGDMYNTTGNSGGNPDGYNFPPNIYGAGNYNTGGVGGGTLGEFGEGFSSGGFGATGQNNGNNFTGNMTYGGYRSSTEGFSGGVASYGANKPQYNGQDDLLGDDYFDDREVAENR